MYKVSKKVCRAVEAFELGADDPLLESFLHQGKIRRLPGDAYEVFSLESVNGSGQIAHKGDFVKVDTGGSPYPVERAFFMENHKSLGDHRYEQIPRELNAWSVGEEISEEILFLIRKKGLVLDENHPSRYFSAPLWGTVESAAKDSVIIFYSISRDIHGSITDIDFNFVAREEFDKTYCLI